MYIIQVTNDASFPGTGGRCEGEGFIGPFASEQTARFWAGRNMMEDATYRIVSLTDICDATL